MTTTITVKANHGWPVKVTQIDPKTADVIGTTTTVPAGQTQDFAVHSTADLYVHEIQPDEIEAEAASSEEA